MATTSNLLIDEEPLMVLPKLATVIGLNEAIVLQQVHYWLKRPTNKHIHKGRKWIYNTLPQWKEQFPFWSIATIQRTIASLENKGLLVVDYFNQIPRDRTKWYSIDYDVLDKVSNISNCNIAECDDDNISNCDDAIYQNDTMLPETNTETTTETNMGVITPPPPPVPKKAKTQKPNKVTQPAPHMTNPAVLVYREVFNLTPDLTQREAIAKDVSDLEIWQRVLVGWKLDKHKPTSLGGILDRYHKEVLRLQQPLPFNGKYNKPQERDPYDKFVNIAERRKQFEKAQAERSVAP